MPTEVVRIPTQIEAPSLVAVTLWRLLLVGGSWLAVLLGLGIGTDVQLGNLRYFTQVSTLCVALAATASLLSPLVLDGAMESRWGVARGASTTYATITLVVYASLLGGDYSSLASLLAHLVVPVMAMLDWMLVGRNQSLAWWWPLVWLAVPLLYLASYVIGGEALYSFLVPGSVDFADWALILTVAFVAVGYGWWGLARLRAHRVPPQTVPAAEQLSRRRPPSRSVGEGR